MTLPVLIILAVLWAVVLVPPLLRSRSQHTADSIVDFNYKLDVLGRTNGNLDDVDPAYLPGPETGLAGAPQGLLPPAVGAAVLPARPARARIPRPALMGYSTAAERSARRRRDVLRVLGLAVVGSLLVAVASGVAAAWALQVFVDLLGVTYFALWAWLRSVQADRLDKVRYMPPLRVPDLRVREMALRRSASS